MEQALRSVGYDVWRDATLLPHDAYPQEIERQLRAARAVLVIWSQDALNSKCVRAEAHIASEPAKQGARPPLQRTAFFQGARRTTRRSRQPHWRLQRPLHARKRANFLAGTGICNGRGAAPARISSSGSQRSR